MYREIFFKDQEGPQITLDTDTNEVFIGNYCSGVWFTVEEALFLFNTMLDYYYNSPEE